MTVERFSSGAPWEPIVGYSRGVLAGDYLFISGTGGVSPAGVVEPVGDVGGQARRALEVIAGCLADAGLSLEDVVRTRVLMTDIDGFEDVARAHREAFATARPATTFAEVTRFADPDMLIEIEAVAYAAMRGTAASRRRV